MGASLISQTALGFGLAATLSRLLGAQAFGQYVVVMTVANIFQLVAAFPVETGAVRFIAQAREEGPARLRASYSAALVLRLAASATAVVLSWLLGGWLSGLYNVPAMGREVRIAALSSCLLTPMALFFLSCIQGLERPRRWATGTLANAAFVFVLVVIGASGFGRWRHHGLFLLIAAGWLCGAVVNGLLVRRVLGFAAPHGARSRLREMLLFLLPIGAVPLLGFGAHTIVKSWLAVRCGPVPVGQFEIALTLLAHMGMFYQACMIVLLPAWARLYAQREAGDLLRSIAYARGALMGLAIVYGATLALAGQWVVPAIFGREQIGAAPAVRVIGLAMPLMIAGWVSSTTNVVSARTATIAKANAVWFSLVVPLALLLVPALGALGAACAWLGAYTVFAWFYVSRARPFFREVEGWRDSQTGAAEHR